MDLTTLSFYLGLFSALGLNNSVKRSFIRIREFFSGFDKHENTLLKCYSIAVRKELKKNKITYLPNFLKLKFDSTLLSDALHYFDNNDLPGLHKFISDYYRNINIDFNEVRNNFEIQMRKRLDINSLFQIFLSEHKSSNQQIKEILEEIKNNTSILMEVGLDKSLSLVVNQIAIDIQNGQLGKALENIAEVIYSDNIYKHSDYKEKLVLLETKILIKKQAKDSYKVQLKKLEKIKDGFIKNYYQMLLSMETNSTSSFEEVMNVLKIDSYKTELKLCYEFIRDEISIDLQSFDNDFVLLHDDAKPIVSRLLLSYVINNFINISFEKFITQYNAYLVGAEIEMQKCLLRMNLMWHNKGGIELNIIEKQQLEKSLQELKRYRNMFQEYSNEMRRSIEYNIALTKILLTWDYKSVENEIVYFLDHEEMTIRFSKLLLDLKLFDESVQFIETFRGLSTPKYNSACIDCYFNNLDFKKVTSYAVNELEYSDLALSQYYASRNIIDKDKLSEENLHLPKNGKNLILNLSTISILFFDKKMKLLSDKYFNLAFQVYDSGTEIEQHTLFNVAIYIKKLDEAKTIAHNMTKLNKRFNLLIGIYYKEIPNGFTNPHMDCNNFFNQIVHDPNCNPKLLELKAEYFHKSGDNNASTRVLKYIIEMYDSDNHWYNYISLLIENNDNQKLRDALRILKTKERSIINNILMGIIHLQIEPDDTTKLSKFSKLFFQSAYEIELKNNKLSKQIYGFLYFLLITNQIWQDHEEQIVSENCFVLLQFNEQQKVICIHPDIEYLGGNEVYFIGAHHTTKETEIGKEVLLKTIGDKVQYENNTWEISAIDSLYNYPSYHISDRIQQNLEEFGLEDIGTGADPIISIFPKLYELKKREETILDQYLLGKTSFHILSGMRFENYPNTLQHLLFNPKNSFNAGLSLNHNFEKIILSFTSILLLELFDKLETLDYNSIVIPNSILDFIKNKQNKKLQNIKAKKNQLSLDLDNEYLPIKYEHSSEDQVKDAKRWGGLLKKVEKFKNTETRTCIDELTPFIRGIGIFDVECIRLARELSLPLVIEDFIINKLLNGVCYNSISIYFKLSKDTLHQKIEFLTKLSTCDYKFIFYNGLLIEIVKQILSSNFRLISHGTTIGNFLALLKKELSKNNKYINENELVSICYILIENHLILCSADMLREIVILLPKNKQVPLVNHLLEKYITVQSKFDFINQIFKDFNLN